MIEIAGIERKTEYSPNHEYNDYLIIHETARELKKLGASVNIYKEDDLFDVEIKEEYIFSMVQSPEGSEKLMEISKNKLLVINSPESVRNCYRYNMNKIFEEKKIPFPKSIIVNTNTKDFRFLANFENELWVKRSDAHAVQREDVVFAKNKSELINILKEFNGRGLKKCSIQNHIEGSTVKFYSIPGKDLFYWCTIDTSKCITFESEKLKTVANKAGEYLGLEVFGGDAIITENSEILLVDMNDWPSFAPIRDKASRVIAELIINKINKLKEVEKNVFTY